MGHPLPYISNREHSVSGLRALLQIVAHQITMADNDSQLVNQIMDKRARKRNRPTLHFIHP
jgi:hypothetical protein